MPAPRITIDARMLFNSGIGVYLRNLLPRVVAGLDAQFTLLGRLDDFGQQDWTRNPRVTLVPVTAPIYSVRQQFELPSLIPPDTALYWAPHYDVPLLRKGKLLVTIHDVAHVALPEIFAGFLKQAYAHSMLQIVRQSAAHIMFVSSFSRSEFERLVGKPAATTSVHHLGLEEGWRSPGLGLLPPPRARPYIVYVGNVKPHKNLKGLLAAFDKIRHRMPHDLVLIGRVDGFLTGDSGVAARLGLADPRVVLAGPLSDAQVKAYVAHAEMLILPSFYEGFGLPPVEAMACGCPVAVARAASMPEICGDAVCYFSPHDTDDMARVLLEVLSSAELARTLRQKGLQQSAQYRWDESAARVRRVIDGLLSARAPREKTGVL